jgi:hypothetical protein
MQEVAVDVGWHEGGERDTALFEVFEESRDLPSRRPTSSGRRPRSLLLRRDEVSHLAVVAALRLGRKAQPGKASQEIGCYEPKLRLGPLCARRTAGRDPLRGPCGRERTDLLIIETAIWRPSLQLHGDAQAV